MPWIPGYQASFPEIHKVPMISGQNAKYLAAALTAYKKGDRKHPTMHSIAVGLSDQDMNDLAAYYEGNGKGSTSAPADKPKEPSPQVAELLKRPIAPPATVKTTTSRSTPATPSSPVSTATTSTSH